MSLERVANAIFLRLLENIMDRDLRQWYDDGLNWIHRFIEASGESSELKQAVSQQGQKQ